MTTLPLNALRAFATIYASGGVRAAARALATTVIRWLLADADRPT